MRLLLTALLLASPTASAASLTQTLSVPGHAAGSFGTLSAPELVPTGGAAWSPDGREVYTLDTAGELKRWRAATGALLGSRVVEAPREAGTRPGLTLLGMGGEFLNLQAQGYRQDRPVRVRYILHPQNGKTFLNDPCPTSRLNLRVCTAGNTASAHVEGGQVVRVTGDRTTRVALPTGVKPAALAISDNGERVAVLGITPKDTSGLHGTGSLLVWQGGRLSRFPLGTPPLEGTAPSLSWVGNASSGYGLLLASNAYDPRTGGLREGQVVALYREDGRRVWDLSPGVGLRGAWPSADGKFFVTFREGSVPEVRRAGDGGFLRGLGEAVTAARPLGGGRALVALGRGGGTGRVAVLGRDGLRTLAGANAGALAVGDRDHFASAQANLIRLHDSRGRVLRQWNAAGTVGRLAFSPDGTVLSAQVWNPRGQSRVQAWRVNGTLLDLPRSAVFPVSGVVLSEDSDKNGPSQAYRGRLSATDLSGQPLWKTGWRRGGFGLAVSADGRWVALSSQAPDSRTDPVDVQVWRLDTGTGRAGPVLRVRPSTHDPLSGQTFAALSPDGRLALLEEGSGDACGWALYGYRLVDLRAGRRLPLPASLASGFGRQGGCGRNLPHPEAHFAPDGALVIRDGNRLTWWRVP